MDIKLFHLFPHQVTGLSEPFETLKKFSMDGELLKLNGDHKLVSLHSANGLYSLFTLQMF